MEFFSISEMWVLAAAAESMSFFSAKGLSTLAMLVLLQLVLGFDNLLYISIESKRAPEDKQSMVRRVGIVLAIVLRIVLLLVIISAVGYVKEPLFGIHWNGIINGDFTLESLITLGGGVFILYTSVKEVMHLLAIEHLEEGPVKREHKSVGMVITWIVLMNLVFSFDSILSAMALTKNFWIMAVAIVIGGVAMIVLADRVAEFLKKNRMYEVLGLFILFIVGLMLMGEGGHQAELQFFTFHVEPMAKTTFYFTLVVLVLIDIVQSRYRKKLLAQRQQELQEKAA